MAGDSVDDLRRDPEFPNGQARPLVVTVELTPEQSELLFRCTGQRIQILELSSQALGYVAGGNEQGSRKGES